MMVRTRVILTVLVIFMSISCYAKKSNVLIICVDDLNNWIGVLDNHPKVETPNIDDLAANGVTFANAYCQAPLCGPSRASMWTGLYPFTTGIYGQISDDKIKSLSSAASEAIFMPDYFEKFGYKTLGAGKIFHQGDCANVFDEYGGNFGIYGPFPEKRMNYDPEWFGKPKGTSTDWGAFPEDESIMPDHKTTEWIIDKLFEEHDKPFFMVAGLVRPHVPWYVPEKWYNEFNLEDIVTPPYDPNYMADVPAIARKVTRFSPAPDMQWVIENNKWKEIVKAYIACVSYMDYNVGKILDALKSSKYSENTVVVLLGDNGYDLGQKGRFAKHSLWRTSTNVPLIISSPDFNNYKSDANVGLIDLYPTLLELCEIPSNNLNEGHSLVPLLIDSKAEWNYLTFSSYGPGNNTIINDNMKYIRYFNGDEELYNLDTVFNEWKNLANFECNRELLKKYRKMLPKRNENDVTDFTYK